MNTIIDILNTPSGDCEFVSFEVAGYQWMAINGGPYFEFNDSISFLINFDPKLDKNAVENLDQLWIELSDDGEILLPLQEYSLSHRFGRVKDRYGLTWQLNLVNPRDQERPFIVPSLAFTNNVYGKAKEASDYYLSIFNNKKSGKSLQYPSDIVSDNGEVSMFTDFQIENQLFVALDRLGPLADSFNEAISFLVRCQNQEEIDYYWEKLSHYPESEQCGWLKDKYGVSWQIWPAVIEEMRKNGTDEQNKRLTQATLQMKKLDIQRLKKAYEEP